MGNSGDEKSKKGKKPTISIDQKDSGNNVIKNNDNQSNSMKQGQTKEFKINENGEIQSTNNEEDQNNNGEKVSKETDQTQNSNGENISKEADQNQNNDGENDP